MSWIDKPAELPQRKPDPPPEAPISVPGRRFLKELGMHPDELLNRIRNFVTSEIPDHRPPVDRRHFVDPGGQRIGVITTDRDKIVIERYIDL